MSNSNRNRDQSRDRHITDDQKVIILQVCVYVNI